MYVLEVLQRKYNSIDSEVVFTKKFNVPQHYNIDSAAALEEHIKNQNLKQWDRDAMIFQLWYTTNLWYPNHYYIISWKE